VTDLRQKESQSLFFYLVKSCFFLATGAQRNVAPFLFQSTAVEFSDLWAKPTENHLLVVIGFANHHQRKILTPLAAKSTLNVCGIDHKIRKKIT